MKLELHNAGLSLAGRWIVREVSLALTSGQLLVLAGPNGSGKSTLLRLLGGLWQPSAGRVQLDGQTLAKLPRRQLARQLAYTPQDTHLDFDFTVREVVAMGRHAHLGRFQLEGERDRAAIAAALQRADVTHLAERFVTELSGGERQRVLIARSLATEAPLILLDEPTANLDIAHALDVLALCRDLTREGKAIALALHDLNLALRFADAVALLNQGRLVASGPTATVLEPATIRAVFGVTTFLATTEAGGQQFVFEKAP